MIQLIWKFSSVCSCIKLRIIINISIWSLRYVTECFDVFVSLGDSNTEIKQIEWNLSMCKFTTCIFEEIVCWLPQINSLLSCFCLFCSFNWWLKFCVSQNHWRNLEKHHFTTNLFDDIVCTLQGSNESAVLPWCIDKIVW